MRVAAGLRRRKEVRDGKLGDEIGAPAVDGVHEVVRLDTRVLRVGEGDGRGIIDDNVDAAKLAGSLFDSLWLVKSAQRLSMRP